jgi:Tol biopolymer transport system component
MIGPREALRKRLSSGRAVALALILSPVVAVGFQARPVAIRSQLLWLDRAGRRLGVVGNMADYGNIELSPDGKQVAVAVLDVERNTRDIWFYDTASGQRTMFTSDPADENWLVWSHDGRRVVFNSGRNGGLDLYQAQVAGKGAPQLLLADQVAKWPVSWSPDGRNLLFVTADRETRNDIWVLPLFGDRKPHPYLQTAVDENWATFSPDGHWVAYSSRESGETEVYVAAFPRSGPRWLVSKGGGSQARWRRDGKELFYLGLDRTLMVVPVTRTGSQLELGVAERLFEIRLPSGQYHAFDVTTDGQRFLVNSLLLSSGAPAVVAH